MRFSNLTRLFKTNLTTLLQIIIELGSQRCSLSRYAVHCLVNEANLAQNCSYYFISFLYMFRATVCPSSGEITVSMRHLIFVTLCGRLSGMPSAGCMPDSQPPRVTNTKCRIDTVISPEDGHTVARNM